jgi:ornithine cyclodeaminase
MIRAHCALRPLLDEVLIWGRQLKRAAVLASSLAAEGLPVRSVADLHGAAQHADIVCCATTARTPIIRGAWIRPGTHLDLVGGFTRDMREVDDAAVRMSRIVVDTYDGALREAGDLTHPLERGIITRDAVVADLGALVRHEVTVRTQSSDVTLFKSVGTALADLAAAQAVVYASD